MTPTDEIRQLILDQHLSLREAASRVVSGMPREVLEADRVAALVRSVGKSLRDDAYLAMTTPEQFQLFEMARSVPRIVRFELDGEEQVLWWQDATLAQLRQSYGWAYEKAKRDLATIERDRGHWERFEGPEDAPLGRLLFDGVLCTCGLPWRPGDPFERGHDIPVGDGSNDQAMRWMHRSCNRHEGTGGTKHEAA